MIKTAVLKIGTRGSKLALWQAHEVARLLEEKNEKLKTKICVIKTTGDKIRDVALSKLGSRGAFTKELDEALLNGSIDISVHSMKDVPSNLPLGTEIMAMLPRADARDAFFSHKVSNLLDLPKKARVGTGSLRRRAQISAIRPDLELVQIRGNIDTRLKKIDTGEVDAVILAAAGVIRLGWKDKITSYIEPDVILPSVGQGAIGIQARVEDKETLHYLSKINDLKTYGEVVAEREVMRSLEGGCQAPLGVYAHVENTSGSLIIEGLVATLNGSRVLRSRHKGTQSDAIYLAKQVYRDLYNQGAQEIFDEIKNRVDDADGNIEVLY